MTGRLRLWWWRRRVAKAHLAETGARDGGGASIQITASGPGTLVVGNQVGGDLTVTGAGPAPGSDNDDDDEGIRDNR